MNLIEIHFTKSTKTTTLTRSEILKGFFYTVQVLGPKKKRKIS